MGAESVVVAAPPESLPESAKLHLSVAASAELMVTATNRNAVPAERRYYLRADIGVEESPLDDKTVRLDIIEPATLFERIVAHTGLDVSSDCQSAVTVFRISPDGPVGGSLAWTAADGTYEIVEGTDEPSAGGVVRRTASQREIAHELLDLLVAPEWATTVV